ncbi:MAG: hypothetical protein V2A78_11225 [bacterium]
MAHAYTPGLRISENSLFKKERRLPLKGEVLVSSGDHVAWDTVVARTHLPGSAELVNIANKLGVDPEEVPSRMLKEKGAAVQKGEELARSRGLFGLFSSSVASPASGTIESISTLTGQVIIRLPSVPVEVLAYVDGVVERVLPDEGVVLRSFGAFIQGIFGIGGERSGELLIAVPDPGALLDAARILPSHRGKVLVGGSRVTREAVQAAIQAGVCGIISGGIDDLDLKALLGYDMGVAVTGSEKIGLTLIITEGFGEIRMAERTFSLLKKYEGRRASINGATQIRAGVIRPEVLISSPDAAGLSGEANEDAGGIAVGSPVRIIREPWFGILAKVSALPSELQQITTGARVRVLEVELPDGRRLTLPRANIERIEG